jgi:hypothetical protein
MRKKGYGVVGFMDPATINEPTRGPEATKENIQHNLQVLVFPELQGLHTIYTIYLLINILLTTYQSTGPCLGFVEKRS